eukprot:354237-Chlamydomonas_euryale.AAC.5
MACIWAPRLGLSPSAATALDNVPYATSWMMMCQWCRLVWNSSLSQVQPQSLGLPSACVNRPGGHVHRRAAETCKARQMEHPFLSGSMTSAKLSVDKLDLLSRASYTAPPAG